MNCTSGGVKRFAEILPKLKSIKINQSIFFNQNVYQFLLQTEPAGNYMLKVNNRNTRARCEICSKLIIKTPAWDSGTGLRPATFLKKRFLHRCFPVNFVKFLRTLFLQNTFRRLHLFTQCSGVFIVDFFYLGFLPRTITNIHDSQDSIGRRRLSLTNKATRL